MSKFNNIGDNYEYIIFSFYASFFKMKTKTEVSNCTKPQFLYSKNLKRVRKTPSRTLFTSN